MKAPYAYELEAIKTSITRILNFYPDDTPDFLAELHDYLHTIEEEYDQKLEEAEDIATHE